MSDVNVGRNHARAWYPSSGAFNPADVDRLQAAFDTAWNEIAAGVLDKDRVTSREQLATIIVATGTGLDAEELAAVAVRTF